MPTPILVPMCLEFSLSSLPSFESDDTSITQREEYLSSICMFQFENARLNFFPTDRRKIGAEIVFTGKAIDEFHTYSCPSKNVAARVFPSVEQVWNDQSSSCLEGRRWRKTGN